jgi:hypothetical protein
MPAPMTDQQARFAVEYATNGGDATRAAINAGYSARSAVDLGRRTALPHVLAAIHKELARPWVRSGAIGLKAIIEIATRRYAQRGGPCVAFPLLFRAALTRLCVAFVHKMKGGFPEGRHPCAPYFSR